jgi:hypothetical protein
MNLLKGLDLDIVSQSIQDAKNADQDEFRRSEIAWLNENNTLAFLAIDTFHKDELARRNADRAGAGFQGALLGSYVIRALADAGDIRYETVRENQRTHFMGTRLAYPHALSNPQIRELFGKTGNPIGTIRHEVARSLCAAYMGLSLTAEKPDLLKDFIAFPDVVVRPRPRQVRRQAGAR